MGGRGRKRSRAEVLWPSPAFALTRSGNVIAAGTRADTRPIPVEREAEQAEIVLFPDEFIAGVAAGSWFSPTRRSPRDGAFVLVEAKRIRRSSFQLHQLAS